jgi:D-glycero-beta-D-manno-heptose-7-phosphate kinase
MTVEEQGVKLLPDLSKARLLVVGDVMLDRYWFGEVSRISPEAPVPVVKVERTEERPGGAANVARNATALGARATLLSVVGDDEAGARLRELLEAEHVVPSLHRDPSIPTTVKLRVIGRHQQLLRVDFETPPTREVLADKLADFQMLLKDCDVLILSDYGKGGLTHIAQMIALARAARKIILVDPKGDDYSRYHGANIVTPNRAELREVVGHWKDEDDMTARAQTLRRELGAEALLVTRSEEGMSLYQESGVLHEAARAQELADVTGAGDTVIAALAAMLAVGAALPDAMHVANRAAGIVVGKLGTAVAYRAELQAALAQD